MTTTTEFRTHRCADESLHSLGSLYCDFDADGTPREGCSTLGTYEVFDAEGQLVSSFGWDEDALDIALKLKAQGHVSAIRLA
jgi:hypothetical protein